MTSQKINSILHFAVFSFILFGLAGCAALMENRQPSQTDQPNIIIILTDDQPYQTLQYMPIVQKELVENGITFEHAYVTTPLCCPSRASILTGQYAHNHGVKSNRFPIGGATVFKDTTTIATLLHDAGYQTALIGKYLNEYHALPEGYIPPGWTEWNAFYRKDADKDFYFGYSLNENGKIVQYGFEPQNYSVDVLNQKAVNFIHANNHQPFFLMLNFYAPHLPYLPAERHKDLFKQYNNEFPPYYPPNYFEANIKDKPAWLAAHQDVDPNHVEGVYQRMMRSLISVDEAVGDIVNALNAEGIRNNTLIIFMSDNGYAIGDHGLIGKACPYEACLHIPFVVSYPHKISVSRVDTNMALNIDIAPTLAELVGISTVTEFDGESLLPLLIDSSASWRNAFLFEQYQDDEEESGMTSLVPPYVGFQTIEWKYVEYETGERELYNLNADPYEMRNLASQPEYDSIMQELSNRIYEIRP